MPASIEHNVSKIAMYVYRQTFIHKAHSLHTDVEILEVVVNYLSEQ